MPNFDGSQSILYGNSTPLKSADMAKQVMGVASPGVVGDSYGNSFYQIQRYVQPTGTGGLGYTPIDITLDPKKNDTLRRRAAINPQAGVQVVFFPFTFHVESVVETLTDDKGLMVVSTRIPTDGVLIRPEHDFIVYRYVYTDSKLDTSTRGYITPVSLSGLISVNSDGTRSVSVEEGMIVLASITWPATGVVGLPHISPVSATLTEKFCRALNYPFVGRLAPWIMTDGVLAAPLRYRAVLDTPGDWKRTFVVKDINTWQDKYFVPVLVSGYISQQELDSVFKAPATWQLNTQHLIGYRKTVSNANPVPLVDIPYSLINGVPAGVSADFIPLAFITWKGSAQNSIITHFGCVAPGAGAGLSPAPGGPVWGTIQGVITNQADLISKIDDMIDNTLDVDFTEVTNPFNNL